MKKTSKSNTSDVRIKVTNFKKVRTVSVKMSVGSSVANLEFKADSLATDSYQGQTALFLDGELVFLGRDPFIYFIKVE
jgi:hypothetical protein